MNHQFCIFFIAIALSAVPVLAHPHHDRTQQSQDNSQREDQRPDQPSRRKPGDGETRSRRPQPPVQTRIELPDPVVQIEVQGEHRFITANGLPDHSTGEFPGRGNPNAIRPQQYRFRVPAQPAAASAPTELRMQPFGVAINGVVFDPSTAEWWKDNPSTGWHIEAINDELDLGLDQNIAHVQPSGAYHYHGVPWGLIQRLGGGASKPKMTLIGWAADGFPIYGPWAYSQPNDPTSQLKKLNPSYRLKDGQRPSEPAGPGGRYDGTYTQDWQYVANSGDLDEFNGRFGITPEFPQGTYYYVVTETFPYVPRLYRGTPDPSFQRRRPPGPPPGTRPDHNQHPLP